MYVRSALFWVAFSFLTAVLGIVGIVTLVALIPATNRYYVRFSAFLTLVFIRLILNIKVIVKGENNLPKAPFIIASKHESSWETAFFTSSIKGIVIPLKRELIYFPFFGLFLYIYGMIYINRASGSASLRKMLEAIRQKAAEKRPILIFPEGTRVKHGEVVSLKSGIAAINKAIPEVPIVPVYIDSGVLWPPKAWAINSGTITVIYKKPIVGLHEKEDLLQKLEKEINSVAM